MNQPQPSPASSPAQTYEDHFVPGIFRPWTEELLARARPRPGERILDLACGTGIVARVAAQRLDGEATIAGLDLSPAMVEVARAAAEREGLDIAWHQGGADALPFPDGAFDLILVQQGLQFFPDKPAALAEVARVLAPGGRVASATWASIERNPFFAAFAEVVERRLGTPALHAPYALGDRAALGALFAGAGLGDVAIDAVRRTVRFPDPGRFVALSIAAAAAAIPSMQAMDEAERAALVDAVRGDMAEPVRRYTEGSELAFPMEAHVAVARRA